MASLVVAAGIEAEVAAVVAESHLCVLDEVASDGEKKTARVAKNPAGEVRKAPGSKAAGCGWGQGCSGAYTFWFFSFCIFNF